MHRDIDRRGGGGGERKSPCTRPSGDFQSPLVIASGCKVQPPHKLDGGICSPLTFSAEVSHRGASRLLFGGRWQGHCQARKHRPHFPCAICCTSQYEGRFLNAGACLKTAGWRGKRCRHSNGLSWEAVLGSADKEVVDHDVFGGIRWTFVLITSLTAHSCPWCFQDTWKCEWWIPARVRNVWRQRRDHVSLCTNLFINHIIISHTQLRWWPHGKW